MNPLELTDYLVAGATLLIGVGVGRRMRPKPPEPLRPQCSCGHGYGHHEGGQKCHGEARGNVKGYDGDGYADKWEMRQCTCLRYDGPDPAIFGLEHRS